LFEPARNWWTLGGKRLFDVIASALGLVLCLPIFILTALAVKLTSRGLIFFSQNRVGKDGLLFRIHKFRSMKAGRIPDPKEIVPLSHPEVTTVGRIIRRLKLDEAPQLFNVLIGQMSLVGPRPTLPDQVERYDEFQRCRLRVRPGITGLAQVNGNTAIDWNERIQYDVYYVAHCGLLLDIVILLRTLRALLLREERLARPFHESPYSQESNA